MSFTSKLNYFDGKLTPGFLPLFISKTIIRVAAGFFGLFLPIFLYNIFNHNFSFVIYYYTISLFLYTFALAFGARFLNTFGFRHALRLSLLLGALNFITLYFTTSQNYLYLIPLNIFVLTLFRIFHWIPYQIDFAKFTDKKNRSREVGLLAASTSILGIATPFIAGFTIAKFGFGTLFLLGIFLYLLALIPLAKIPKTREQFSWTYKETWRQFFSAKRRKIVFAFAADGAENVVGLIVWPIFIFNILKGNYLKVGTISTLIITATVIMELIVGKVADSKKSDNKNGILKFGTYLYSFGWILKVFIATAFQIFIVDAYHKLMQVLTRTSFDALTYEIAANQGHFIDEFSVLHEMAIGVGKVIMLLLVLFSAHLFSLKWTFILAAFASILLNFIRSETKVNPKSFQK